jgi:glycosyltransferase involved in cell wall biosynthesis
MNIFVIIPGFNEQTYLGKVLDKVTKLVGKKVIYVDDGSTDSSAKVASKYTSHVLVHETNLGKGAALLTGCEYAFHSLKADAVIFMDSDDQHDAEHLPEFIALLNKYDVVFGVRNLGANMPLLRFLGNKFASVLLNVLYGAYIADIPSGYKALTHKAFKKVKWKSSGYEVETEIAVRVAQHKIPFGIVEIKSIYHDTDKGMTLIDALHITFSLLQWRIGL